MPTRKTPAKGRPNQSGRSRRSNRLSTAVKVLLGLGLTLAAVAGLFAWGLYYYFTYDLPNITSLKDYARTVPLITTVYADDGHVIGEFYKERRRYVPIEKMPRMMVNAFVAAEDQRFFEHHGLDYVGIVRAFLANLKAADARQGGSTLTQQVARTFFLTREKSIIRKVKEAILATRMEHFLSKEEILNLYMNHIYLGHGAYGVEAAAENYFGKTVGQLNLAEMALVAAMPKAPSRLNPFADVKRAVERQRYVIDRMLNSDFISTQQAEQAKRTRIVVNPLPNPTLEEAPYFTEVLRQYLISKYGAEAVYEGGMEIYTTLNRANQKAAEAALRRGLGELDRRQGYRGPIKHLERTEIGGFIAGLGQKPPTPTAEGSVVGVVTWIAPDEKSVHVSIGPSRDGALRLEDMAWARKPDPSRPPHNISSVSDALSVGDVILVRIKGPEEGVTEGARQATKQIPKTLALELDQAPEAQGSLLSLEPRTGHVFAWVGGIDFSKSQFDRVTQSHRQPGSAFKPIIYAAALDKGFTPTTVIIDSPVSFTDTAGNVWSPRNYDEKFKGPITMREALAHSRNVPTVKILQRIGVGYVIKYAHRLGITSPLDRNLSLALGSGEVTLLEMTRAYAVFASQGQKVKPVFVRKILSREGQIIAVNVKVPDPNAGTPRAPDSFDKELPEIKKAALDPEDFPPGNVISRSTAYQMVDLMQGVVQYGTGQKVKALGRPTGGKTGTTNDLRDAWFIGFTPQLVTGVWVGFDQERPLGYKETGGKTAAPIWLYYMQKALEGQPVLDFEVPKSITFARVNYQTGLPATEGESGRTIFEVFKEGQEPGGESPEELTPGAPAPNAAAPTAQRNPLTPPPVNFFRDDYQAQ